MRIIIHETYEYEIDAATVEQALQLFEQYRDDVEDTGVIFNQNYLHTYNEDMKEI